MTCDTSKVNPRKKHKETNFPFGSHRVLYIYASCHTRSPLYSYFFWGCKSIHFSTEKVLYFSTKRLCFAECWFSFIQRWNNWQNIGFTVYSILIKAKAKSNMNTALIRALTNVKLRVSMKYVMTLPVRWILDLWLLTYAKGGIKYLNGFDMHLIPVKGKVKHDNNFDSTFTRLKAFQHTTALDTVRSLR